MTRVVGYIRVSTADQADSGLGLAAQEEKIRAYAKLYDLEVVALEVDAGISAKTMDRPAFLRALSMLGRGADGILVAKLDRLTRSVRDLGAILQDYFTSTPYTLFSVADQVDTRSASGRLVLNILASVSEWEREVIAERTKAALSVLKASGKRAGNVPLGKRALPDGTLVDCMETLSAMRFAKQLRECNASWSEIVGALNCNYRTQSGGLFTITTARRYAMA
jgi:DNA invertase Pin-like site-specific DNA recombinase